MQGVPTVVLGGNTQELQKMVYLDHRSFLPSIDCASHLNSNQWKHVIASGILKFCVRGLLGKTQEKTLMELCDVLSILCSEQVNIQNMDAVEYRVHRVLSLMERDFPATVHVITLHLLHHLPMYMQRFGPVYSF